MARTATARAKPTTPAPADQAPPVGKESPTSPPPVPPDLAAAAAAIPDAAALVQDTEELLDNLEDLFNHLADANQLTTFASVPMSESAKPRAGRALRLMAMQAKACEESAHELSIAAKGLGAWDLNGSASHCEGICTSLATALSNLAARPFDDTTVHLDVAATAVRFLSENISENLESFHPADSASPAAGEGGGIQ